MMNRAEKESLYQLIREYSHTRGSSMATIRALRAYQGALMRLSATKETFPALFREINELIERTEPRVIPLIQLVKQLEQRISPHFDLPFAEVKSLTVEAIEKLVTMFEKQIAGVIENGVTVINENDFIITHSPSMEVEGILKKAHVDHGLIFRVLVVEQDFVRIRNLIRTLGEVGIDHQVISEHHLSHYVEEINKLFLGAVSISSDQKVITTAGSANIAGLCRFHRIPIYLFTCSLKFDDLASEKQQIPNWRRQVRSNNMSYPMTSYSHDIVDLALIDHVVTEEKCESPS